MGEALQLAQAGVDKLDEEKGELAAKVLAAEALLADKTTVLKEKVTTNASAKETVAAAATVLAQTEESQRAKEVAFQELQQDKANVESAIATEVNAIANGESQGKSCVAMCKKFSFDETLTLALPATCARAVADRGAFDKMVLDQLETALKQKLIDLSNA